ncbi:MAG: glucose-1-phosphate thymidylyltransferase RfbA [Candidatus Aminicenantes bacterium]|nr:glucose-1-phosphate thymidylyltransferase RfbA [Candidatus Aminicenantes bacterium]NIQ73487.1 glucose-1-phosphate thymidylyltransferase RfbA [Candidatus Aminicenantes bacterium]NIT29556.1 glucose-1-phosphate thymidylyltransferase RfbA [Candidatus Aminicenantes bacterium]
MKGIILAGGSGTRLYPITIPVSKQLLPVYDKPMIYYPLSILMLANIRDILIITTPQDSANFEKLLGSGNRFGIRLSYAVQEAPNGLAEAFIIGENFIGGDSACLILGDNIFYGQGLVEKLEAAVQRKNMATIFGYYVKNPKRYGVAGFDKNMNVISIEEKPKNPASNYAITGLYFYPNDVIAIAKNIKPSWRGELEITDVNKTFLERNQLKLEILGRGFAWLDTGTYDTLMEAGAFVEVIERRQGLKIACLEEIAFDKGYISLEQLEEQGNQFKNSQYGQYILELCQRERK